MSESHSKASNAFNVNNIYIAEGNEHVILCKNDWAGEESGSVSDSWADMVDTEISCYIENKLLTSSSNDSINKNVGQVTHNVMYNIGDIVSKNPENIDDMTLLEWQTYLSSHLKKYIKQCAELADKDKSIKLDYSLHISKFEWLARASRFLSDKLGLIVANHKVNNFDVQKGIISRSSYKFCEYNYDCQFNYKEKYNGCYAQHFVHNLVCADVLAMIQYIKSINESNRDYNYDELVKCITTISYVIKHMYEELCNLQFHYGNIDGVHIEKSKVKKGYHKQVNPKRDNKDNTKRKLKCRD
jgi:hypothetical protein